MVELKLGLNKDVPHYDYLAAPYPSVSRLNKPTISHAEVPSESGPAANVGSACHCLKQLGRTQFRREFAVLEKVDGRTKDGKAYREQFLADNIGKIILTQDQYTTVLEVCDSITDHGHDSLFEGLNEASILFDTIVGLLKSRPDTIQPDDARIVDLKTTGELAVWKNWARIIDQRNYDMQAAAYVRACRSIDIPITSFVHVVAETQPPYGVAAYELPSHMMRWGERKFDAALKRYEGQLQMAALGWKSYPKGIQRPAAPDYMVEIDVTDLRA